MRILTSILFLIVASVSGHSRGQCLAPGIDPGLSEPLKSPSYRFSSLSSATLKILKKSDDAGVALGAAWEENSRVMTIPSDMAAESRTTGFSRFVRFVDGRLPAEIPEWWMMRVSSAEQWDGIVSFGSDDFSLYEPWDGNLESLKNRKSLRVLRLHTAVYEGQNIVGSIDGQPFRISSDLIQKFPGTNHVEIISPVRENKFMYVVLASFLQDPGLLVKIDLITSKEIWRNTIRGSNGPKVAISAPTHSVEPKIGTDGNVYVFGTDDFGTYVEAFTGDKGTPLFRFSSNKVETAP